MESRKIGRLTLYGPHPLERDSHGHLKYPMADIFPDYGSMIVGSGLHITLALDFLAELDRETGTPSGEQEQSKVYEDLVALILRGNHVIIRSIPDNMEQCFRAAELLEEVVPTDMIRFTSPRDQYVREAFKTRGECWKMAPRFFTRGEIIKQIRLSLVSVGTRNRYYYKMESGGRLMTYQQFAKINQSLVRLKDFRNRICEVVDLYGRKNKQLVRELDFFMVDPEKFDFSLIEKLAEFLNSCKGWGERKRGEAAELYLKTLSNFKGSVPREFLRDDPNNSLWRNYIYSELNDVPPTEESILGMSKEFNMNIRWIPGCRIKEGRVVMDSHTDEPTAELLREFFRSYGHLEYINLGRVMQSQSTKRAAGGFYREVYIAVLKQRSCEVEQIRMIRRVRRNTLYYLNRGLPLEKAERMTGGYLQYVLDRREILSLLGVNTPPLNCLRRHEKLPGIGTVTVAFFDRPYIDGTATDKVPDLYYEKEEFVRTQAALLGEAAGMNLVIGRGDPESGDVFFGDGDEMLIFDDREFVPGTLVLADFTGAFSDVISPLEKFLPFYLHSLVDMLDKVKIKGLNRDKRLEIADIFIESMKARILLTREMLQPGGTLCESIMKLVADREEDINPVRVKWELTLKRLQAFDLDSFIGRLRNDLRRRKAYS